MIRVVTALPAGMLQELLGEQIGRALDFRLAGNAANLNDLADLVAEAEADAVIGLFESAEWIPEVYRQLLDRFPRIVIVGVLAEADTVVLCHREIRRRRLPSIGVASLLSEVRLACGGGVRDRHFTLYPGLESRIFPFSLN